MVPTGAVAAERTKITVLLTVDPTLVSVTLLPYPVVAESDTSKLVGAVTVISAVKPVPEVVIC